MKTKIKKYMVLIGILSISAAMLLITVVYYDLYKQQILLDLKTYAQLLVKMDGQLTAANDYAFAAEEGIRITFIDEEGWVTLDSQADSRSMDNHKERPEIKEAFINGEGMAIRESRTFGQSTFYYALYLENGSVVRVSREADSIYSIFCKVLPSLGVAALFLLLLCLLLGNYLTRSLVRPIVQLTESMDETEVMADYEELNPFIQMIRKQHEDIMKSAKVREEFTANVSHELKTPLTAISGYAELIETGMASAEDVELFARGIHSSATRLLTLINDIIRLSELDDTEEEPVFERLNLFIAAQTCVDMLGINAEKHEVELMLTGKDCYITGNKQMIEELLYNLCDNAIRYNNKNGKVMLETYEEEKETILIVQDTGIGIPMEHQERIFERFYRVDKSRSKQTGGTGLGLAIVKHILVKHDARMELKSEEGVGTMIKIAFPHRNRYKFHNEIEPMS